MITVGITGGFATGKTVVADILRRLGAKILDADKIAHNVMQPDTAVWKKAVDYFGENILRKDRFINRKKLAKIIFADSMKRQKLNQFTHSYIIREIKNKIKADAKNYSIDVLALDAPLLYEAGIEYLFNRVIVVKCSKDVQYKRAKKRSRLSSKEIFQRVNSQWPLEEKVKRAHFVIENSGSIDETMKQVKKIWEELTAKTFKRNLYTRKNKTKSKPTG